MAVVLHPWHILVATMAGCITRQQDAVIETPGPNLTDPDDGFLAEKKFVILDRDSKYSAAYRDLLKGPGVEIVRLAPRSLNLNAYAERFVRSIEDECLNRMIFFGERSLRKATREYAAHYHGERNHQGIDNRLIEPGGREASASGSIECVQRFGGMLRFYHRAAAQFSIRFSIWTKCPSDNSLLSLSVS